MLAKALENLKNLHFSGVFFIKVYNFWTKEVQRSYIWWYWRFVESLKKIWLVLSKMTWRICQGFVHRLKISDFVLGSKMAELNLRQSIQWNNLNEVYPLSKVDISAVFMTRDFQTGNFFICFNFWQVTVVLQALSNALDDEKQYQPSLFHKKFKNQV